MLLSQNGTSDGVGRRSQDSTGVILPPGYYFVKLQKAEPRKLSSVWLLFAEEAAELLQGAGGVLFDVAEGILSTGRGATGATEL